MDGVIADFDKLYSSTYGCFCREDPNKDNWFDFVNKKGFVNIPLMVDALLLLQGLANMDVDIEILSCISNKSNANQVRLQKIEWLYNKGFGSLPYNFTATKSEKSDYATEETLLIDDSVACVNPFREAGGYAILHKNARNTIIEIDCMIKKGLVCALSSDQKELIH